MAIVKKLLGNSPSLESMKKSLSFIDNRLNYVLDDLNDNLEFQSNLLGVNLDKIFSNNLNDFIKFENGKYTFLSDKNSIINAKNVVLATSNDTLVTHKQVMDFLDSYVKQKNYFDTPVRKMSETSNAVSVQELLRDSKYKRETSNKLITAECVTDLKGNITDSTFINYEYFKEHFYNKGAYASTVSFIIDNNGNKDIKAFTKIEFDKVKFKEIKLDYTLAEIEGAGCKLTSFIETQKAVKPTQGIYHVMVNVLWPTENKLVVNGQESTYTPDPANDTPDIVADTLGSNIDIDGVDYQTIDGYYSNTPEDDDNEYKLGWFARNTEENKEYHVVLKSDNTSDHDLKIDWDSDKGNFIVTYASDGGETEYPTIGELLDDVNGYDSPVKVRLVDSDYTRDDDYSMEMKFDLDQYTALIEFTSDKQPLTFVGTPDGLFEISTVQKFADGVHQEGKIDCVKFSRGYKYFVKVDDTELDIDLTKEENYPNITDGTKLMTQFNALIKTSKLPLDSTIDQGELVVTGTDYNEHAITTSGASSDYQEPLPRSVTVLDDVKEIVEQGNKTKLYKNGSTLINNIKANTPICKADINQYVADGYFANKERAANIKMDIKSFQSDKELPSLEDVYYKIEEMLTLKQDLFPSTALEFITRYDLDVNAQINSPEKAKVEKWGVLTFSSNVFLDKKQLTYFKEIGLDDLQTNLLGLSDSYLSKELNTFGDYITKQDVKIYEDVKNVVNPNKVINNFYHKLTTPEISNALDPIYPTTSYEVLDKNNANKDENFIKFADVKFTNYNSLDFSAAENNYGVDKVKHTLFAIALTQQSPNALMQISYVLGKYYFDVDEIRMHMDNEYLANTVLDMSTDEAAPEPNYGLDGQSADGYVTFSDLYIREYKPVLKNDNSSTTAKDYFRITEDEMEYMDKLYLTMPAELVDAQGTIKISDFPILLPDEYSDFIYKDNVKNAYFPHKGFLNDKIGSGITRYNDNVWAMLIRTIHFVDTDNVAGVQNSVASLRILHDKYKKITPWEFALMLSSVKEVAKGMSTIVNGLFALYIKIYEYIKENNITPDKYLATHNQLVGLLIKNDSTAQGILPPDPFRVFLTLVGEDKFEIDPQDVKYLKKVSNGKVTSLAFQNNQYIANQTVSKNNANANGNDGSGSGNK